MIIFTGTNKRADVATLWCEAIRATVTTPVTLVEAYAGEQSGCADRCIEIPNRESSIPAYVFYSVMPKIGERMFIEEDIIPVIPWSPNDYPGELLFLDAAGGAPWPSFAIARTKRLVGKYELVQQRFIREGGCPDWLPQELCEPAIRANAKVVGSHFLHIDKLYRDTPFKEEKTELIEAIRSWIRSKDHKSGLGDIVASALSSVGITKDRVQKVASLVGIKDCGCKQRQEALNRLGKTLGFQSDG